jgi:hypothetical protein
MSTPFENPIPLIERKSVLQFTNVLVNARHIFYNVVAGLPDPDDPDDLGGLVDDINPSLTLKSSTSKVIIDCQINGQWLTNNNQDGNRSKTVILVREDENRSTGSTKVILYGAQLQTGRATSMSIQPQSNRVNGLWLDGYSFRFVDDLVSNPNRDGTSAGDTISYYPLLISGSNTHSQISGKTHFKMNMGSDTSAHPTRCDSVSSMSLTEVEAEI